MGGSAPGLLSGVCAARVALDGRRVRTGVAVAGTPRSPCSCGWPGLKGPGASPLTFTPRDLPACAVNTGGAWGPPEKKGAGGKSLWREGTRIPLEEGGTLLTLVAHSSVRSAVSSSLFPGNRVVGWRAEPRPRRLDPGRTLEPRAGAGCPGLRGAGGA